MLFLFHYIKLIKSASQNRGVFTTGLILLENYWFDFKYGIDTQTSVQRQALGNFEGYSDESFYGYDAVHSLILRKTLKKVNVNIEESVFLDFGCGKGRALIYAALLGFKKVIGVELSQKLCEITLKNMEILQKKKYIRSAVEVINKDATSYIIPDEVNVIFFFNPFKENILESVINNIKMSLRAKDRPIYIIYINPRHAGPLFESGLKFVGDLKNGNRQEAIIFSNL